MSWVSILKRDPLKDNLQQILAYTITSHLFVKAVHDIKIQELKDLGVLGKNIAWANEAEMGLKKQVKYYKQRAEEVRKAYNNLDEYRPAVIDYVLTIVLPDLLDNKEYNMFKEIEMSLPEKTHSLPKKLNFNKIKRELELFVDEGDLT